MGLFSLRAVDRSTCSTLGVVYVIWGLDFRLFVFSLCSTPGLLVLQILIKYFLLVVGLVRAM